ncbi:MAG: helix-turn-helix domain-containing protein [Trueperaceae bacterium]
MAHEYITWAYSQQIEQPLAKFVLVCLADAADSSGRSFPGQKRLSDMTGMSVSTLRRHLKRLEADGYLQREERRRKDGTRTSDEYQLPHKASSGQIGPLFATGQPDRLTEERVTDHQHEENPPPSTGQPDTLSGPRSTGQIAQSHRSNWALDTNTERAPSSTAQTPAHQPVKLTGHEPLTTREPINPPPLSDSVTSSNEEEAEKHDPASADPEPTPLDLSARDASVYRLGRGRGQTDSHLPTFHPETFKLLVTFRKLHGPKANDEMFRAWATTVQRDIHTHSEPKVNAALETTIGNFASLKFPFSFYEACVKRRSPPKAGELATASDFEHIPTAAELLGITGGKT